MSLKRIKRNVAKCLLCGDVMESVSTHDFRTCSCGSLSVDGGKEYIRRNFKEESCFEELTEMEDIPVSVERKPTGIQAFNGMMYVGDTVSYEDGWLAFTNQIVEVEGKFGFIIEDEFEELSFPLVDPAFDIPGLDFEIVATKAPKTYPAVFSYQMGKGFAVVFPDLDVATSGEDEEEAMKSAQELLKCVLIGLEEDGLPLPVPTELDKVKKEPKDHVRLVIVE